MTNRKKSRSEERLGEPILGQAPVHCRVRGLFVTRVDRGRPGLSVALRCTGQTGSHVADAGLKGRNCLARVAALRQHCLVSWRFPSGTRRNLAVGIALLIVLELVRRIGLFATCYVELRYDPLYAIANPRAVIAQECFDRHIIFPLGL